MCGLRLRLRDAFFAFAGKFSDCNHSPTMAGHKHDKEPCLLDLFGISS